MTPLPLEALVAWAEAHPEIVALSIFGSHAKGTTHAGFDLDLAFDLCLMPYATSEDDVLNRDRWRRELLAVTDSYVRDLYLRHDPNISGPFKEIYRRPR
jgi:hypothetical protein